MPGAPQAVGGPRLAKTQGLVSTVFIGVLAFSLFPALADAQSETGRYCLTTAVSPQGAGSVIPASISWHNAGTVVSVSATANPGYTFDRWGGDLSGNTTPQNLTISSHRFVIAHFALQPEVREDQKKDGAEGEVWKPDDAGEEEEFFEEEEEEESDIARTEAAKHEFFFEYRMTDIFDEPSDIELGPPADNIYYFAYQTHLNRTNSLRYEESINIYNDDEKTDSAWALIYWDKLLSTGARLGLEFAWQWDEFRNDGFWTAAEYSWSAGLNLDLTARVQGSNSLGGVSTGSVAGWGTELRGKAALNEKTALEARMGYFGDETGGMLLRAEAELARHLGHQTALHVLVRGSSSKSGDPAASIPDASSIVATVGLKHRFQNNMLVRGAYRFYSDSEDITANGFSIGFEQPFKHGSFGAHYRRYRTNEDVKAGTWVLTGSVSF